LSSLHVIAVAVGSGAWWAFKGELRGDWAAAKEEVSEKNEREDDRTYQKKKPPVPVLLG
jgi:hypothetical protein